jgi:hypothetical protein
MFIKTGDPEKIVHIIKADENLEEQAKQKLKLAKQQAQNVEKLGNNSESNQSGK